MANPRYLILAFILAFVYFLLPLVVLAHPLQLIGTPEPDNRAPRNSLFRQLVVPISATYGTLSDNPSPTPESREVLKQIHSNTLPYVARAMTTSLSLGEGKPFAGLPTDGQLSFGARPLPTSPSFGEGKPFAGLPTDGQLSFRARSLPTSPSLGEGKPFAGLPTDGQLSFGAPAVTTSPSIGESKPLPGMPSNGQLSYGVQPRAIVLKTIYLSMNMSQPIATVKFEVPNKTKRDAAGPTSLVPSSEVEASLVPTPTTTPTTLVTVTRAGRSLHGGLPTNVDSSRLASWLRRPVPTRAS